MFFVTPLPINCFIIYFWGDLANVRGELCCCWKVKMAEFTNKRATPKLLILTIFKHLPFKCGSNVYAFCFLVYSKPVLLKSVKKCLTFKQMKFEGNQKILLIWQRKLKTNLILNMEISKKHVNRPTHKLLKGNYLWTHLLDRWDLKDYEDTWGPFGKPHYV